MCIRDSPPSLPSTIALLTPASATALDADLLRREGEGVREGREQGAHYDVELASHKVVWYHTLAQYHMAGELRLLAKLSTEHAIAAYNTALRHVV
eukprot:3177296-Rhodomonas_salina.2